MPIFLIFMALWPSTLLAHASFYCKTESMDEADYLPECTAQTEARWVFSESSESKQQGLAESLENIQYDGSHFLVGFSAHQFFQRCWANNIDIATSMQPRFLIIALDHNDILHDTAEIFDLWQQTASATPLIVALPLWDLKDQPFFNTRELRGKLSQNYQDFLKRYDAQFLVILRGSLNEDLWDFRITSNFDEYKAYLSGVSIHDIVLFLRSLVLKDYALSHTPTMAIISFDRSHEKGLALLKKAPEIIQIQPRLITSDRIEFRLWSYWTAAHSDLLAQEYGFTILSHPH